ncbi:hypothetical protein GF380_06220, partial [Candidatus Uhrbacteria bacterium]|nr:hypothetical protein [Candidatus Uhrbacteria bacterium]MBD3284564.1 hypothetical protein [Candidatus Uhrbacteria bacterium]
MEETKTATNPQTPAPVGGVASGTSVTPRITGSAPAAPVTEEQKTEALPTKTTTLESLDLAADSRSAIPARHDGTAGGPNSQPEMGYGARDARPEKETAESLTKSQIPNPKSQPSTPASSNQPTPESSVADAEAAEEPEGPLQLPDLTPAQIAFMTSERYISSDANIKQKYALSDDDLVFLNEMDHAVLGGLLDLEQYVQALREEFPNLNDKEKDEMIGILLADRFDPFGMTLTPNAQAVARKYDLKLPQTEYYRIYERPLTYMGAAHEVARAANIPLMGQTQERLRDIIVSRVKGVRVDAQVEEQLHRNVDLGGLGLDEAHARKATEVMVDLIDRAKLVTEEEYSKWFSKQVHGRINQEKQPEKPVEKPLVTTPEQEEEEKEIAQIISRMPKEQQNQATVLAGAIRKTLELVSWKPEDPYLQRRFTNMISTRLRDVRSRNEFFMKLMRDVKVGGLSLKRDQAEEVTEQVEEGYKSFRGNVEEEERKRVERQLLEQRQKIE